MTFPKIELHVHLEGAMRAALRTDRDLRPLMVRTTGQNSAWPPALVPAGQSS